MMQRIVILGAGASGKAAAALAAKEHLQYEIVTDELLHDNMDWGDAIVASPGVPPRSPMYQAAKASGKPMWSELEFGAKYFRGRIAAITGTDGKTTTTELVTALLKSAGAEARFAGNIGVPLCTLAEEGFTGIAVVEVSSFQLELVDSFAPEAAAVLNISMDHRDRYPGGEEEYRAVKYRIFNRVSEAGKVFGRTMPELTPEPHVLLMENIFYVDGAPFVNTAELALKGEHNLENIGVALELVYRMAGPERLLLPQVRETLRTFKSGPHRIETVCVRNGITFVDDSKATNPHAVAASVRALSPEKKIRFRMLMGGLAKGMDFSMLDDVKAEFAKAYLFGACREQLKAALSGVPCQDFGTGFEAAVRAACHEAQPGEIVLLAPGCASMDMFKNYEERGNRFRDCVLREM